MKFFNLDVHISAIADVKDIIKKLFPDVEIIDWSISNHTWIFGRSRDDVKIINERTWINIDKKMILRFQEYYNDFLKEFDGFIVTHSPVFTLLFEKYNKPIILVNTCRYEQPFSKNKDFKMWEYLEEKLYEMYKKGILIPICNNLADLEYLKIGTNINGIHIPSLGLYINEKYSFNKKKIFKKKQFIIQETGSRKKRKRKVTKKILNIPNSIYKNNFLNLVKLFITHLKTQAINSNSLFISFKNFQHNLIRQLKFILKERVNIKEKKRRELRITPYIKNTVHKNDVLKPGYKWKQLFKYKGIIHIPYEISTASIYEQYSANMPLFFPSKNFLKDLIKNKKIPFYGPYIKKDYPKKLEIALGKNWIDFWIDRATYYDGNNMKYITFFDNFEDLKQKLTSVNTEEISKKMSEWNKIRIKNALIDWYRCLLRIGLLIQGKDQINMDSEFGNEIYEISKNKKYNTFLEIRTQNGQGSTVCIMNALLFRPDDSKLYSIENNEERYKQAVKFWEKINNSKKLEILYGKITDNCILKEDQIKSHPLFHLIKDNYLKFLPRETLDYDKAPIIYYKLPKKIDVILLDGGEFSTEGDFNILLKKDPQVIILNDTNTIKSFRIREKLLEDSTWILHYDNQNIGNGCSIFIRK